MTTTLRRLLQFTTLVAAVAAAGGAVAGQGPIYEVKVTNLTRGQIFTPILVASHRPGVHLFTPGEPAGGELTVLAEGGDIGPLAETLGATPGVQDIADSGGLLFPGEAVTVQVSARGASRVSLAAMLVPTNDGFIALNGVVAPWGSGHAAMYPVPAYDAGTETNDEACVNIPGPCEGEGPSPQDAGEGYVHVHAGIHGIGDLEASERDWRNPVARVEIRRRSD